MNDRTTNSKVEFEKNKKHTDSTQSKSELEKNPAEVNINIASYLPKIKDIVNLFSVSKTMHQQKKSNLFWKFFTKRLAMNHQSTPAKDYLEFVNSNQNFMNLLNESIKDSDFERALNVLYAAEKTGYGYLVDRFLKSNSWFLSSIEKKDLAAFFLTNIINSNSLILSAHLFDYAFKKNNSKSAYDPYKLTFGDYDLTKLWLNEKSIILVEGAIRCDNQILFKLIFENFFSSSAAPLLHPLKKLSPSSIDQLLKYALSTGQFHSVKEIFIDHIKTHLPNLLMNVIDCNARFDENLLTQPSNCNLAQSDIENLLKYAISKESYYFIQVFFRNNKFDNPNICNSEGTSLLHIAILGQSLDLVKLLLIMGANPSCESKKHGSPLMLAGKKLLNIYDTKGKKNGLKIIEEVEKSIKANDKSNETFLLALGNEMKELKTTNQKLEQQVSDLITVVAELTKKIDNEKYKSKKFPNLFDSSNENKASTELKSTTRNRRHSISDFRP